MSSSRHRIAAHFDDEVDAIEAVADLRTFRGPRGVEVVVHHGGCVDVDDAETRLLRDLTLGMAWGIPIGIMCFALMAAVGTAYDPTLSISTVLGIAAAGGIFGVLVGGIVGIALGSRAIEEAHRQHNQDHHLNDEVVVATVDLHRFHRWMVERTHTRHPAHEVEERDRMEATIRDVFARHHGELLDVAS